MRETAATLARRLTMLSFAGLCVLVGIVGVVGVLAEFAGTWDWFFRYERLATSSVPLVLALLGLSVTGAIGTIVLAPVE